MNRWQFSTSTILIGTSAIATWLWILLLIPRNVYPIRFVLLAFLCGGTVAIRRITRNTPNAWSKAALSIGLAMLFAVSMIALFDDSSILGPAD